MSSHTSTPDGEGTNGDTDESARNEQAGGIRAWALGRGGAGCRLLAGQHWRARHRLSQRTAGTPDRHLHPRRAHRPTAPDPLASLPQRAILDVSEVDYLIDGKLRWVEHNAPYFYGSAER